MRILILEDTDERIKKFRQKLIGHEVTVTKSSTECIKILTDQPTFDYIFLDHDLCVEFSKPGKDTGYKVAEWISNNPLRCPRHVLIHSLNNTGAAAMMARLGEVNIRATYIPFLWEKLDAGEIK